MTETSKEYAVALFSLAAEEHLEKTVSDGLKTVSRVLRETPEYLDFLASPNIPVQERTGAIDKAFSDGVHEYVVSFLKILCEKNNVRYVHKIIEDYEELYHATDGISTAKVISAVPLKKDEKEKLKAKLEAFCGHTVIMECSSNSAILGGVIVHIDGKVLDGSLRRRLRDIKEKIET
ncbi:MAG: ATP synthase F1 subunit delta [Clostridia bacterium]|nr:ATP synthase F1 subunit delta [Clostridia bacterium]